MTMQPDREQFSVFRRGLARDRVAVEPEALPVYHCAGIAVVFLALACALTDFSYDGALDETVLALTMVIGFGLAARWIGFPRLAAAVEGAGLFGVLALLAPLVAVVVASTNLPLADASLVAADRLFLGFERQPLLDIVTRWPTFMAATRTVYHTLMVQPFILIAALALLRQERRLWTFLLAWSLALGITLALFPLAPAIGAPPYFFDFLGTFEGARDGTLRTLGHEALTGIITFPSFHAAAAVLLGWGFSSVRPVAPLLVALNVLMFASALIAGHYLIDLVAGGLIAWFAIRLAKRITSDGF